MSAVSSVVQKFGGTSVADPERMRMVAEHVARCRRRGDQVTMVVSAMGKETDELLHLASQISHEPPGREADMLITAGERKAVALMAMGGTYLGFANWEEQLGTSIASAVQFKETATEPQSRSPLVWVII